MREVILEIVREYAVLEIAIFISMLAIFILIRMQRQLKRLNRNLSVITKNVERYFEVILTEEEAPSEETFREEVGLGSGKREMREEVYLTKEERDMLLSNPKKESTEDEEVFNAVLKEYFS